MMIHQIDFFDFPMKIIESESIDKNAMLLVSGYPVDDEGKPLEGDDYQEWVKTHVVKMVNIGGTGKEDRFDLIDVIRRILRSDKVISGRRGVRGLW